MTSDLSATALRDTVARVRANACDAHLGELVCADGDHCVTREDLLTLLTALARLQEERDRILEREARLNETRNWWVAEYDKLKAELDAARARDGGTA